MGLTITNMKSENAGSQKKVFGTITFDSSYASGGEQLTAKLLGMTKIEDCQIEDSKGYAFDALASAGKDYALIKVYRVPGFTPAGSVAITPHADSAGTPAGTNANSVVTGQIDLATPVFSGTGYATVGQVVTTTDNQTMTLNQCAGMWLVGNIATEAPVLIVSNTAVSGAPAVLTVQGTAPVTDAGAYKIVRTVGVAAAQTFTGSALANHSHASTAAFTGAAVAATTLVEVTAATNLSSLAVDFVAYGK